MRCRLIVIVLIVILTLSFVFAAPTKAPPSISDSTSDTTIVNNTDKIHNSLTKNSLTQKDSDLIAQKPITPIINNNNDDDDENSSLSILIIISIINSIFILIIILISIFLIVKINFLSKKRKQKDTDLEFQNTNNSVQYSENVYKLEKYIRENLYNYSFKSIKDGLKTQGFTEEEINSVYYKIIKNDN